MDNLSESVWFNPLISLMIALSVCFAIQLLLARVFKPKGLWWVFILLSSTCIFLAASTLSPNEGYFYWLISSAKWGVVGIAGLSIQHLRKI